MYITIEIIHYDIIMYFNYFNYKIVILIGNIILISNIIKYFMLNHNDKVYIASCVRNFILIML